MPYNPDVPVSRPPQGLEWVGDDGVGGRRSVGDGAGDLARQYVERRIRFALGLRLADADDGDEAGLKNDDAEQAGDRVHLQHLRFRGLHLDVPRPVGAAAGHQDRQRTQGPHHRERFGQGVDRLIVGGGDGTVGRIAKRLIGRDIPVAPLPFGTANNISKTLGLTELTLKEIGDKYNLSRERIRQLQEQALGKIRKHMRD